MATINLLVTKLSVPQWIIFGICAFGVLFLLLILTYFLYLLIRKPELKAEIAAKALLFKEEAKQLKAENERNLAEIKRSGKAIEEKTKKTLLFEDEIARMRIELMQQGVEEEQAREISSMTISQLQLLKSKEMTDVSGAFIINAITRRVLIDSEFERRGDVEDFKVPLNKTTGVDIEKVDDHLLGLLEVTKHEGNGKRASIYKTADRTIALLYDRGDGRFKLTVKCGSYYGLRLCGLYPKFVEKAKYPYGMTWFDITDADECSMELIQLLADISYNIAKAGF